MRNPNEVRSRGRMASALFISSVAALFAASCGSKGSVAVTAAIQDPVLALSSSSPLVAKLDGHFGLHIELGQMASSRTDISISEGGFHVAKAADSAPVLDLAFIVAPAAPYHVEPGGKLDLLVTLADKADQLGHVISTDERGALCAAAMVQIAGSFQDATTGQVQVKSLGFTPSGCP